MADRLPTLYQRHWNNLGFGIMLLRDYSMGRETPKIPEPLAMLAQLHAFHTDGCKIYLNPQADPKYMIGHRGISPRPGDEAIAEFEFISQN